MKLLHITKNGIKVLFFSNSDNELILKRCKDAGKQWSHLLHGFFINALDKEPYAAITVKGNDGIFESMEYVDIERNKPEFSIDANLLAIIDTKNHSDEISLQDFEPLFNEIITSPVRARRWEVYPEINQHYLQH